MPSALTVSISRRLPATLTPDDRDDIARFVTRFIAYPRRKLDEVLDSADYVWLCHDGAGELVGTTAVRRIRVASGGDAATVIYTAMVAVAPEHRRAGLIPGMGMRSYLLERARAPLTPLYWLSLSASPSAYLQMARNFVTFWPRPDCPMPAPARAILDEALASLGASRIEEVSSCLRLRDDFGVSDRDQHPSRWDRGDPDVDFFLRVNPDYMRGSDLACLCELSFARLAESVLRQLGRHARGAPQRGGSASGNRVSTSATTRDERTTTNRTAVTSTRRTAPT